MEIFLVTMKGYDVVLIDSAWATPEEAQARIDAARAARGKPEHPDFADWSERFKITPVTVGEVRSEKDRFDL